MEQQYDLDPWPPHDQVRIRYSPHQGGSALGFIGGDNYGNFNFTGGFTGDAFGDFLLGLPSETGIDQVVHDNYGLSMQYGVYAQDSFRVSSRLTLEYGARWEFHPGYTDQFGNIGNFVSVPKSGEVVYPDAPKNTLAPLFLASFNACPTLGSTSGPAENGAPCTPVLDASQADYRKACGLRRSASCRGSDLHGGRLPTIRRSCGRLRDVRHTQHGFHLLRTYRHVAIQHGNLH